MKSNMKNKYHRFSAIMSCLLATPSEQFPISAESISRELSIPLSQLRQDLPFILSSPALRAAYQRDLCGGMELTELINRIDQFSNGWEILPLCFQSDILCPADERLLYLTEFEKSLFDKTLNKSKADNQTLLIKDPPLKPEGDHDDDRIKTIQDAIDDTCQITFNYRPRKSDEDDDRDGGKAKPSTPSSQNVTTLPLRLLEDTDNQRYYCIGLNRDTPEFPFILYRLSRMRHISRGKISEREVSEAELDLLSRFDYVWGADLSLKEQKDPVPVRLKILNANNNNVIEKIRTETSRRKYGQLTQDPADPSVYYYTDQVIGLNAFRHWINKYGKNIVVLEPAALARRICESAYRRLQNYQT